MNLTDEEIRIKVAEAMGICHHPKEAILSEEWEDGNDAGTDWTCTICKKDPHYHPVPNYPLDLNACAEFEATLTDEEQASYVLFLNTQHPTSDILSPDQTKRGFSKELAGEVFGLVSAAARQRCLAYLKTKGIIP